MNEKRKPDKERKMSYDSLPPNIRDSLSEEEKQLFLYSDQWPDTLFEKLADFIVKD